jgi:hypothetical protein
VVFSEKDEKVYRSLASEYFPAAAAGTEDDKPPKKDTSADESTEDEDRPLETSSQATVVGPNGGPCEAVKRWSMMRGGELAAIRHRVHR